MTGFLWKLTAVAATAIAANALAGSAYACVPSGSVPSRWYGAGIDDNIVQNDGAYADIYVSASGVADYAGGGHINETIWEAVANSATGNYWVEGGWTHGYHGLSGRYFYWGRNTPANGYADHRVNNATPTVGTSEPVQVSYAGGGIWNVFFNFVKATSVDGSVANISAADYSRSIHFGLESTSSGNYTAATSTANLQYRNPSTGSWSNSIPAGSTLLCDSPATATWVTTNVKMRSTMN